MGEPVKGLNRKSTVEWTEMKEKADREGGEEGGGGGEEGATRGQVTITIRSIKTVLFPSQYKTRRWHGAIQPCAQTAPRSL